MAREEKMGTRVVVSRKEGKDEMKRRERMRDERRSEQSEREKEAMRRKKRKGRSR